MYRREVDGKVYDFDHTGYVYKGSFVMFDKQTGSEWIHVTAECVMGPLKGKSLDFVPAQVITWQKWKALHPDTTVFSSRNRWKAKSRDRKAFSRTSSRKQLGLNVVVDYASKLYPYSKLEPQRVINDVFQKTPLAAVFVPQADCAVAWIRKVDDRTLTFEPASRDGQPLRLKDKETGSLWDPLRGKCVKGALRGKQLEPLVAIAIYVGRYRAFYPDGEVFGERARGRRGKRPHAGKPSFSGLRRTTAPNGSSRWEIRRSKG